MRKCKYKCVVVLYLLILMACNTESTRINEPPQKVRPTDIVTVTPVLLTPSPRPTIPFMITPNADQLARWQEYERALAKELIPSPESDNTLCEWMILGQSEQKVYVWALCQVSGWIPTSTSAPAVIYLGPDGVVQGVEVPRDGQLYSVDVQNLFPADIQRILFAHLVDVREMEAHITYRMKHPEPPLCILNSTVTP